MNTVRIILKSGAQLDFVGSKQDVNCNSILIYKTVSDGLYTIRVDEIAATYEEPAS